MMNLNKHGHKSESMLTFADDCKVSTIDNCPISHFLSK